MVKKLFFPVYIDRRWVCVCMCVFTDIFSLPTCCVIQVTEILHEI